MTVEEGTKRMPSNYTLILMKTLFRELYLWTIRNGKWLFRKQNKKAKEGSKMKRKQSRLCFQVPIGGKHKEAKEGSKMKRKQSRLCLQILIGDKPDNSWEPKNKSMTILIWNVRGMNRKERRKDIKEHMKKVDT